MKAVFKDDNKKEEKQESWGISTGREHKKKKKKFRRCEKKNCSCVHSWRLQRLVVMNNAPLISSKQQKQARWKASTLIVRYTQHSECSSSLVLSFFFLSLCLPSGRLGPAILWGETRRTGTGQGSLRRGESRPLFRDTPRGG